MHKEKNNTFSAVIGLQGEMGMQVGKHLLEKKEEDS